MASAGVGAAAGAGAGGDDGRDDQNVRRFFEASYDNLNKLKHRAPENCPRCNSKDFKFAYYNNGHLSQPRYICKTCKRGWTHGGVLHDIPVGGHKRKRTPATRPEVVPTVVPAAEIPSNSRKQEQVMAPPMPPMPMPMPMPMPDVSQLIEAGLSMMRTLATPNQMIPPPMLANPVMNYHQEVPSFYPLTTTTTGWSSMVESSVNNPAGWNLDDIVHPPPPPPPQPQAQQQPEVVTLNHGEIDDDDDFNTIMEWSIEDLLASDDEF